MKVDARSERWREHRKKVRAEIVDAAFRAIDRLGPELSLREIAEEAGTAKPKIYRHFTDKSDLFQAIGERLRDMLWAAIFPSINMATDSGPRIIRRSVEQYVGWSTSTQRVRFLIQGRFAEQRGASARQRGPRDHAGDGRHVQQRTARDGARRGGDRAGRVHDVRLRRRGDRLVAGCHDDSPRRMAAEDSSRT